MSNPSSRTRAANKVNAQKSTGPRTNSGKARSAGNARVHGILSANLLIDGESPADYDLLFQSLVQDLRPVGALELIHVERIATAIWRQRRLIRAESAAVKFRLEADDTRKMLTDTLGIAESARFKNIEPLSDGELRHLGSLVAMLEEFAQLESVPESLAELRRKAPVWHSFLIAESEAAEESNLDRFVRGKSGIPEDRMQEAIAWLLGHYRPAIAKSASGLQQRLQVSEMRAPFQAMKSIPPEAELYARYQTSIDNALTKAIRALREAQELRLSTLEHVARKS